MKKYAVQFALVLLLAAGLAFAQAMPSQQYPSGSQQNTPQATRPTVPEQQQPGTEQAPDQNAKHDRGKDKNKAASSIDDESLRRQVKEQLATNPSLVSVEVRVEKGKVVLEGNVPDKNAKKQAKDLAKAVPGVSKVEDKLRVGGMSASTASTAGTGGMSGATSASQASAAPSTSKPSAAPSAAGSIAGNTQAQAGSTQAQAGATQAQAGAASAVSGSDVEKQIHTRLQQELPSAAGNFTVNVSHNVIRLSGNVASDNERKRVEQIVAQAAPAQTIVNNINVSSAAASAAGTSTTGGTATGLPQGEATQPSAQTSGMATGGTQMCPCPGQTGATGAPGATGTTGTGSAASSAAGTGTTGGMTGATSQTGATATTGSATGTTGAVAGQTGTTGATAGATTSTDMQSHIQQALHNEPTLANDNIMVNVTDDTIELSGTVATGKDRQTARRIAQSFAGNKKVVDRLTVTGRGRNSGNNPGMSNPQGQQQKPPMTEQPPSNQTTTPPPPRG